ncbi:MAG: hypothetical protein H7Z16_12145 [Pyrinomonadaceae bacterium]|nr:hypothetical protein [Pyrinomonadaceae bacterium]
MNDWINKELQGFAEMEKEKQRQESRRTLITSQSSRLWGDLKFAIQSSVQQLNQTPELRKRVGELKYQDGIDRIEVTKQTFPAIYLTITNHSRDFGIERLVRANVANPQDDKSRETLDLELDSNDHIFMINKAGKPLTVDDAVHYLFAPFLHPELLGVE